MLEFVPLRGEENLKPRPQSCNVFFKWKCPPRARATFGAHAQPYSLISDVFLKHVLKNGNYFCRILRSINQRRLYLGMREVLLFVSIFLKTMNI